MRKKGQDVSASINKVVSLNEKTLQAARLTLERKGTRE